VVAYFLKGKFDKIDVIYQSSLSLPEDVKKIKEIEIPKISKRLDDQQSVLVALVSATGRSVSPEFKGLLENLLKSLIKAEIDRTIATITTLQTSQSVANQGIARLAEEQAGLNQRIARLTSELNDLSKTVALAAVKAEIVAVKTELNKLSELMDKQQKVAAVSWIAPFFTTEKLAGVKAGEVIDLGAMRPTSFVVKSPAKLSEITKDITRTYGELGLEFGPAKVPDVR
jgi:hypothetical protein